LKNNNFSEKNLKYIYFVYKKLNMATTNEYKNGEFLEQFYDDWSDNLLQINFINETLAIHFGYYTKGIKTMYQAVFNMNDYIAELLHLQNKKNTTILDAGCGIGGSSIYLAKKYPNVTFTGITIAPNQVALATKFAKERNAPNTKFITGNYTETNFSDNTYDGIFALESSCYATDHKAFINEMYRILKPGGRLVVIDAFRTNRPLKPIMQKIYRRFCIEFGYTNLVNNSNFDEYLKEKGFVNVISRDITKNIRRSVLQWSLVSAPYFVKKNIKRIVPIGGKKTNANLSEYYNGNTTLAAICGLSGIIGYFSFSALKN
jgi:tocopherol O-methyltransferase